MKIRFFVSKMNRFKQIDYMVFLNESKEEMVVFGHRTEEAKERLLKSFTSKPWEKAIGGCVVQTKEKYSENYHSVLNNSHYAGNKLTEVDILEYLLLASN